MDNTNYNEFCGKRDKTCPRFLYQSRFIYIYIYIYEKAKSTHKH